eukprot:892883-Pyramimonas_sp.AAC.2
MSGVNACIVQTLGEHILDRGIPYTAGGDWNMGPCELRAGVYMNMLNGAFRLDPHTPSHIYDGGQGSSNIDYYMIPKAFDALTGDAAVELDNPVVPGPHRPVGVRLRRTTTDIKFQVLVRHATLPTSPGIGPTIEPPDYDGINAQVGEYIAQHTNAHGDISSVTGQQRTDAQNLLDSVYEEW